MLTLLEMYKLGTTDGGVEPEWGYNKLYAPVWTTAISAIVEHIDDKFIKSLTF